MPRRHSFDFEEFIAFAQSGDYRDAPDLMEKLGIPSERLRSVQKALRKYVGPVPKRLPALRKDPLRRRVIAWMAEKGIDVRTCSACLKPTYTPMYFRETAFDDDLTSMRLVCRDCKHGGDF